MQDRKRYKQHCEQHLELLHLLERERNEEASAVMQAHLQSTLKNLTKIRALLKS
jgi:DNA-binding GntR family transcriptional regulator